MTYLADTDSELALGPLQAAACTYRIALGPRAGQKVLTLQAVPSQGTQPTEQCCVNEQGFSLHAAVRCAINQCHKLEHLCRYITRPAIANERLKLNRAGQVVLQLKTAYQDGTTHIVMSPLEFMQRLAALVPRPRLHLIRFHGVLAPNAKHRSAIIPSSGHQAGNIPMPGFPSAPVSTTNTAEVHRNSAHYAAPVRISWARLLKRVFDIDVEHCPQCGGTLKIIAAIENPDVIAKILAHLRLVRSGTTPIAGAVLRSNPNGLILNEHPTRSRSLCRQPSPWLSFTQKAKTPETSSFGPVYSRDNSPIPDRDCACLTANRFSRIFAIEEKGFLKFLFARSFAL